jgi:hypothetical protein
MLCLFAACEGEPPLIYIAQVDPPRASLPDLPSRSSQTIITYTQALPVLDTAQATLEALGGHLDIAADGNPLDCGHYFDTYQKLASTAKLGTTEIHTLTLHTVDTYNTAIEETLTNSRDMYLHCRETLLGIATHDLASFQHWGLSRWSIAQALDDIHALRRHIMPPVRSANPADLHAQVNAAAQEALDLLNKMGGQIDSSHVYVIDFVKRYEKLQELPTFDVSGADPILQRTYNEYRRAVDEALDRCGSLYHDGLDIIQNDVTWRWIPTLTWTLARHSIAESTATLHQVLTWLE